MTSRKINTSRKLSFQQLETRQMMSGTPIGNVTATQKNGTLTIKGDNNSDGIEISQSANNQLIITGMQGNVVGVSTNPTKVNGKTTPVVFNGVTGDVNITFGTGNDFLLVSNAPEYGTNLDSSAMLYLPRNLSVNMGNGNNELTMGSVTVGGKMSVTCGSGDDQLGILTANIGSSAVNGGANDCTINLGGGNNTITLGWVSVERDLQILDTASKSDQIVMYEDYAGRDLLIETGAGNDSVQLAGVDAASLLDIYTGAGEDQVTLGSVGPLTGAVEAGDQIWVDLGAGSDTLDFTSNVTAKSAMYLGNAGIDHYFSNGFALSGSFSGFENFVIIRG
jgi:hypothetical protein